MQEETETETFEWHQLKEIAHETRCHAICFSPDTSLAVLPKCVKFCAAGADYNLRIFRSALTERDTVHVVRGMFDGLIEFRFYLLNLNLVNCSFIIKYWNSKSNLSSA